MVIFKITEIEHNSQIPVIKWLSFKSPKELNIWFCKLVLKLIDPKVKNVLMITLTKSFT